MADMQDSRHKKRKHQNKVRVKLPGIESFEKNLEFSAEGPGRVVVRLERLMGSDRIRITDPKYLSTLVERLEADEAKSWGSRSRIRKKAEKNRSRQLAIEGLMEPTQDMQDLYEHPVFRVNRVLNRLSAFDQTMSVGAVQKIAPIIPIEPFTEDETGEIFKSYPQHQVFHKDVLPYTNSRYSRSAGSRADLSRGSRLSKHVPGPAHHGTRPQTRRQFLNVPEREKATGEKSTKSIYRVTPSHNAPGSKQPSDSNLSSKPSVLLEEDETNRIGEDDEEDSTEHQETEKPAEKTESLQEFMLRYGVPSEVNLVKDWQAFQSHLVETVCEETGGSATELYDLAGEVIGVYDRQLIAANDFVEARIEKAKQKRKEMGLLDKPQKSQAVNDPQTLAVEEHKSKVSFVEQSRRKSAVVTEDEVPLLLENQPSSTKEEDDPSQSEQMLPDKVENEGTSLSQNDTANEEEDEEGENVDEDKEEDVDEEIQENE